MRLGLFNETPLVVSRAFYVLALLVAFAPDSWSQKASNWRVYRLADGLPESGCISVTFSPQRKVLVRHLNVPYVTELDGYTNTVIPAPEGGKSRVYQSPGGQYWTVVPGGIQEFRQGNWILHPLSALAAGQESGAKVIDPFPLQPVRQGIVLFLQPEGLMLFNADKEEGPQLLRAANRTSIGRFFGMGLAKDGGLWISGERGLARIPGLLRSISPETEWREYLLPGNLGLSNLQGPQEDRPRTISTEPSFFVTALAEAVTNSSKVAVRFDGQNWEVLKAGDYRLRHAWRGPEKGSWGMSINSIFRWEDDRLSIREMEDVFARQYFDVAVEPGGAFWLATSDGLYRYAQSLWSCPKPLRDIVMPVACIAQTREGSVCFATATRVNVFHNGILSQYPYPPFANRLQARAFYFLRDEALLLAMQDPEVPGADQLFKFIPATGTLTRVKDSPERILALGSLQNGELCIQNLTSRGLQLYDGRSFEEFSPSLSLPGVGTNLNAAFAAQNGDVWIGGDEGVAVLHEKSWRLFSPMEKPVPEEGLFFAELPDGRVWSATKDQIWEYDGRNWTTLRRHFDRINGLLRTRDGGIWVASNNGVHRFFHGAWVEHGMEEGLPAQSVRGFQETTQGLWLATTRGLTFFHPEADPETDAPRTWVTKISGENQTGREGGPVTITFTGMDKWKHTSRERLLYSFRLDEQEWSPFEEIDHVSFSDLSSGKHYFKVRAMDRNSNIDPRPAQFDFTIVLPWYRETRLVIIALAGVAAALFFGGLALNKHLQLLRSYAEVEEKVAERTRQLEIANRELLHSQKMTALGTLAAGIAHDFNNILSIIKGSAQIIEDNLQDTEKIQTRTNRIRTVVEQGAGIVKAMLGFSRESGPKPELCNINAVIGDTLRLLGDRFIREVQVKFEPANNLPQVATARDFVQQILLNFIFNAAESMVTRKQIILSSQIVRNLPGEIILPPSSAAQYVTISVKDLGCGIPPENLERIFEPFFTTKALSARRGTGLGLSMVYELAKKLGAGIAVQSVVDEGSTFTLILPVNDPPLENLPAQEKPRHSESALPL